MDCCQTAAELSNLGQPVILLRIGAEEFRLFFYRTIRHDLPQGSGPLLERCAEQADGPIAAEDDSVRARVFLLKTGIRREAFVAPGIVLAVMVDANFAKRVLPLGDFGD